MPRPRKSPLPGIRTPEEGAIATTPAPVREQIKQMSGHATEEEMAESLPTNTMTQAEEPPKRKRRTKEEMAASRAQAEVDPNMSDPRYAKAISKMRAFGSPRLIKGAFSVTGAAMNDTRIPLNEAEGEEIDDYFYVMGKKFNLLDPTNHWFTMALYFLGMLGTFIVSRVIEFKGDEIKDQIGRFFGKPAEEKPEEKEEE